MTALHELVESVANGDPMPLMVEPTVELEPRVVAEHHSVEVEFLGQRMVLRTDEDPTHVAQLVEHVQDKIDAIASRGQVIAPSKVALLAAINICDDYFRATAALHEFKHQVADIARTMLADLDGADAEIAAKISE